MRVSLVCVFFFILFVLTSLFATPGLVNNSCGTANESGSYTINVSSLAARGQTCINITANNVVLNLNGVVIDNASNTGLAAINITGNNTIVANGTVTNHSIGISLLRANNVTLQNILINNSTSYALYFSLASNNTVTNVTTTVTSHNGADFYSDSFDSNNGDEGLINITIAGTPVIFRSRDISIRQVTTGSLSSIAMVPVLFHNISSYYLNVSSTNSTYAYLALNLSYNQTQLHSNSAQAALLETTIKFWDNSSGIWIPSASGTQTGVDTSTDFALVNFTNNTFPSGYFILSPLVLNATCQAISLSANTNYWLVQNISGAGIGYCLDFSGQNSTLDMRGFSVSSSNTANLRVTGANVTMANGTVLNALAGVYLENKSIVYNITAINLSGSSSNSGAFSFQSGSDNSTVYNNTVINSSYGANIASGVSGVTYRNSTVYSSDIGLSSNGANSNLSGNKIFNTTVGIYLGTSSVNSTISSNNLTNNYRNFRIDSVSAGVCQNRAQLNHSIATSNTIDNSKVSYYLLDSSNRAITWSSSEGVPGWIFLVNSSNITISNVSLNFSFNGIALVNSSNITINNATINETADGVQICNSVSITLNNSVIGGAASQQSIGRAVYLENTNLSTIQNTNISDYDYGFLLSNAYNNTLTGGLISRANNSAIEYSTAQFNTVSSTTVLFEIPRTRTDDGKRTRYSFISNPASLSAPSTGWAYYRPFGGYLSSAPNNTFSSVDINNTGVAYYIISSGDILVSGGTITNNSEGVILNASNSVNLSSVTMKQNNRNRTSSLNYMFRSESSNNTYIPYMVLDTTGITIAYSGNLSVNASGLPAEAPYGISIGALVNITNLSTVSANLTIAFSNTVYDSSTIRAYKYNGTNWSDLSTVGGVSVGVSGTSALISNITSFSVFGLFGNLLPPTAQSTSSQQQPTFVLVDAPEVPLSWGSTANGTGIEVSTISGAAITLTKQPSGPSEQKTAGSDGIVIFNSLSGAPILTGTYSLKASKDKYSDNLISFSFVAGGTETGNVTLQINETNQTLSTERETVKETPRAVPPAVLPQTPGVSVPSSGTSGANTGGTSKASIPQPTRPGVEEQPSSAIESKAAPSKAPLESLGDFIAAMADTNEKKASFALIVIVLLFGAYKLFFAKSAARFRFK